MTRGIRSGADSTPRPALDCLTDDEDQPAEVTLFNSDDDLHTHWLSIDIEHAIPRGEYR